MFKWRLEGGVGGLTVTFYVFLLTHSSAFGNIGNVVIYNGEGGDISLTQFLRNFHNNFM